MKKRLVRYLLPLIMVVALSIVIPVSGGGCMPNSTCPDGWGVMPVLCALATCQDYAESGYCFRCIPPQY